MRFSCGETWEAKKARMAKWRDYFAWFPMTIGTDNGKRQCLWLETIEVQSHPWERNYNVGGWWHSYRLKPQVLTPTKIYDKIKE